MFHRDSVVAKAPKLTALISVVSGLPLVVIAVFHKDSFIRVLAALGVGVFIYVFIASLWRMTTSNRHSS